MKEVRTTFAKENTCQPVLCKSCSSKELVDPRKICVNAVPNCWHDDEHRVYNWIVEALTTSDESVFMIVYYLEFWQPINKIVFQKECRPYKCNSILQKFNFVSSILVLNVYKGYYHISKLLFTFSEVYFGKVVNLSRNIFLQYFGKFANA